jgi:hypothetical protein
MMNSAAQAFAWDLWAAQRRPLQIAGCVLLAAAPLFAAIMSLSHETGAVILGLFPALAALSTIMNALVYSGENAGRLGVGLPTRLFVLPLRTAELVAWPMLCGVATMIVAWLYLAFLLFRPHGFDVGLLAPALALASLIAWIQALSWSPLRHPWINLLVTVVTLSALIGTVAALWLWLNVSSGLITLLLIVYLIAAYGYAVRGVGRNRMGEGRDRAWVFRGGVPRPSVRKRALVPFRSASRAQLWYEWRIVGLVLPIVCGGYLVFILVVAICTRSAGEFGSRALLPVTIVIPVILAGTLGGGLARLTHYVDGKPVFPTFLAARPLSSATMVAIKLRMSILSVLLTWAMTVAVVVTWIIACGVLPTYAQQWSAWTRRLGGYPELWLLPALAVLIFVTWRQYTDTLWVGLSGRRWLKAAGAVVFLIPIVFGGVLALTIPHYPKLVPPLLRAVPYILWVALFVRGAFAVRAFHVAYRRGLLSPRTISGIIIGWFLAACVIAIFVLSIVPGHARQFSVIVPAVAFVVPLARFPASVLALEANRRR